MWTDQQQAIAEITSAGWIREVQWHTEVDSTNELARRNTSDNTPAIYVADRQTRGRGRNAHSWWSPEGCLMMTLAIDGQKLPADSAQWSQLALVCGIAVANTASQFVNENVELKWPNDVYLRGRKLAGILIESAPANQNSASTVNLRWLIGIGLNVNMNWLLAPPELSDRATCLSSAAGRQVGLHLVLVELAKELARCIDDWRSSRLPWAAMWSERCLLTGRIVHVRASTEVEWVGRCEGIDGNGRLIVRNESSTQFIATGEVLAWQ